MIYLNSTLEWYLAIKRYWSAVEELTSLSDQELKSLGMERLDIHPVAMESFVKNIS